MLYSFSDVHGCVERFGPLYFVEATTNTTAEFLLLINNYSQAKKIYHNFMF